MKQHSDIHDRLLAILRTHPEGIAIGAIRRELGLASDEQQHLDRRVRDLDRRFTIDRVRERRELLYVFRGERDRVVEAPLLSNTTKARIRHRDGYRCQACGKSPSEDQVKLEVDHKLPQEWMLQESTDDEDLWTLCSACNGGKRNFFADITDPRVRKSMVSPSVYMRIGELLKAYEGQPVAKTYIQLVASTHDDFEKRMRELRELGWKYHPIRRKEGNRVRTYFVLDHWEPWPADPAGAIRAIQRGRGSQRR